MFKGRTFDSGTDTGNFTGLIEFEDHAILAENVGGHAIHKGVTLDIDISHETSGYDTDFYIYVADSHGVLLRFVSTSAVSNIVITIVDDTASSIVIVANDDPDGTYNISWSITMVNQIIDNPIELLRDLKKRQNWSEIGVTYDWGKDVVPGALIKVTGDGSFNSAYLIPILNIKICGQIHDYGDGWISDMCQGICERFFLLSYQDENGYECIKYIFAKENPSTVIDIDDIKAVGEFTEPSIQNTFCAPVINYGYDYATEKFTGRLSVEKPWADTYTADCATGFAGTDGQTVWNLCSALYEKTRQIEPMPSNLSDCYWVKDYAGALWVLQTMLYSMTIRRQTITVGFEIGYQWNVGTHIKIKIPHTTDDLTVECMIETIEIDKDNNSVKVQLMILDDIETELFTSGLFSFSGTGLTEIGSVGMSEI